jgi:glycosyltransferase involved in cell wall biosynthesis
MSLARPIVASRVGGLAEVLDDGATGLLTEVGDVAGIAGAVARLANAPDVAAELGRRAGEAQRERYTLDLMGSTYVDIYRRHAASRAVRS